MRPNEVAKRSFRRAFRGYDTVEVDSFLGQVGLELERLERRVRELETTGPQSRVAVDDDASDLLRRAEEAAERIVTVARAEREQLRTSTRAFLDVLRTASTSLQDVIDRVERSADVLTAAPEQPASAPADVGLRVVPSTATGRDRRRIARPTTPTVAVLHEERAEHVR